MLVNDLKGELLDFWVAKAEGFSIAKIEHGICYVYHPERRDQVFPLMAFYPSTSWRLAGSLLEKHKAYIEFDNPDAPGKWLCHAGSNVGGVADTAAEALCRAIVSATYGAEIAD